MHFAPRTAFLGEWQSASKIVANSRWPAHLNRSTRNQRLAMASYDHRTSIAGGRNSFARTGSTGRRIRSSFDLNQLLSLRAPQVFGGVIAFFVAARRRRGAGKEESNQ
jgi:hypothetical protein